MVFAAQNATSTPPINFILQDAPFAFKRKLWRTRILSFRERDSQENDIHNHGDE
jgi:hypothetical protein